MRAAGLPIHFPCCLPPIAVIRSFAPRPNKETLMPRRMSTESSSRKGNGHSDGTIDQATPIGHQKGHVTQKFGTVVRMPIGLDPQVCRKIADALNQILADTMTLRDLYKKHHWQVSGHT